jgi:hypothetical protein
MEDFSRAIGAKVTHENAIAILHALCAARSKLGQKRRDQAGNIEGGMEKE